ncbi:hypothetical protein [Candidatus Liberibacter sp.]|uniref:hypothetical protein n=1 Tax=Candidatus Liberibacter sp. TaxID=34022 RepID=UPI0015F5DB0B|nr:hypothetical protein [Candidatus Liberibacter sp.]MBA5724329.1 hypothetical protein [Candidatus Liberibacter sp.]
MKKKLSLMQVLLMFTGVSCGPYFLVNFGTQMHNLNMLSLLIAFIFMGFFYYQFMLLLEDLAKSTNSTDIRDMVMAVQPKYHTVCTWLFYIYFVVILTILTSLTKTTLDCFGFIPNIVQYGLIFSVLFLGGKYENLLIGSDVLFNLIKFFFVSSFIIVAILFFYSHPESSILKQNMTLGISFNTIISGLLFAMGCFVGMDTILHVKSDMDEKVFRKALRAIPIIAGSIYVLIILVSGSIFTSEEQGINLIPAFFKDKLGLMLINRIELSLMLIMQFSSIMTMLYLASKMSRLCLPKVIVEKKFGANAFTIAMWIVAFFSAGNGIAFIFEVFMCIIGIHFPILHILRSRQLKQKVSIKAVLFFIIYLLLFIKKVYDLIP